MSSINSENETFDRTKPLILFDGSCRFCRARVEQLRKMDDRGSMQYFARQEAWTEDHFPAIKSIPLDDGILYISPQGKISIAADAIYEIACQLPKMRYFAWLYKVPLLKQLFQLGYKVVAKHRKRLGQTCSDGICNIE